MTGEFIFRSSGREIFLRVGLSERSVGRFRPLCRWMGMSPQEYSAFHWTRSADIRLDAAAVSVNAGAKEHSSVVVPQGTDSAAAGARFSLYCRMGRCMSGLHRFSRGALVFLPTTLEPSSVPRARERSCGVRARRTAGGLPSAPWRLTPRDDGLLRRGYGWNA